MKLYIDDKRTPKTWGWTVVTNYIDAVKTLRLFWDEIEEVSLDHDLGEEHSGYDIAKMIEFEIEVMERRPIPVMRCHSANPPGRKNIEAIFNKYN